MDVTCYDVAIVNKRVRPYQVLRSLITFSFLCGLSASRSSNVRLTNRFHVAVRLFSNRSQMTSKCGKNKKVAHEAIAECVTDVLTTF